MSYIKEEIREVWGGATAPVKSFASITDHKNNRILSE